MKKPSSRSPLRRGSSLFAMDNNLMIHSPVMHTTPTDRPRLIAPTIIKCPGSNATYSPLIKSNTGKRGRIEVVFLAFSMMCNTIDHYFPPQFKNKWRFRSLLLAWPARHPQRSIHIKVVIYSSCRNVSEIFGLRNEKPFQTKLAQSKNLWTKSTSESLFESGGACALWYSFDV